MDLEENLNIGAYGTEKDHNDLIYQLTKEKEQLVSEGRYLEAETVKLRINEMKGNMTGQKKKNLDYQHAQEIQNLEENFNKEVFELNQKWEVAFNQFGEKAKKFEENINLKQKVEMDELIRMLDASLPRQVKFSREYLDLKQSEMNLVKQERYVEAHYNKSKCDVLEKNETDKHNKERNEKIKNKSEVLAQKQNLERNALKQKLDVEYEMMKIEKNDEMGKIVLKYKNRKIDLDTQQKSEKHLADNENLLKAKTASVRYSNTIKNFNTTQNNNRNSPSKLKYYQTELKMKELARPTQKGPEVYNNNLKYVSSLNDDNYVNDPEQEQENNNTDSYQGNNNQEIQYNQESDRNNYQNNDNYNNQEYTNHQNENENEISQKNESYAKPEELSQHEEYNEPHEEGQEDGQEDGQEEGQEEQHEEPAEDEEEK